MWKAAAGHHVDDNNGNGAGDDDWETDPDFVNDVSEQEQRWGSKTIEGSGRTAGTIDMSKLREETEQSDANKKKQLLQDQNAGYGYGGKFGLEKDRMDKCAMGNDYVGKVEKHESQTDHSKGFGGKFGVQEDRRDKSALGWDHVEKVDKHGSQLDHSKGFGGKFGVQEDRRDKSALGWDHVEKVEKHESQVDHKTGFGGKFGVQSDRMDKSAVGFQDEPTKTGTAYTKTKPEIFGAKPSSLRAKFENFSQVSESDAASRAAEQKRMREEKDRLDRERAAKDETATSGAGAAQDRSVQRKGAIQTGREGGIGNAINRFNQPKEEVVMAKKTPIEIPRGAPLVVENNPLPSQAIPDVVQQVEPRRVSVERIAQPTTPVVEERMSIPPPAVAAAAVVVTKVEEQPSVQRQVSSHDDDEWAEEHHQPSHVPEVTRATTKVEEVQPDTFVNEAAAAAVEEPTSGQFQSLPTNEDLSEYIEDTGVRANALYDYQAAAEDEISFDPDDLITHIEMIDEGWWRGLCKNKYGLFPANYVQLLK